MSARHPISALAVLGAILGVSCGGQTGDADVPSHGRPASTGPVVSTRSFTLARSVRGRPIVGHELGVPSARTRVLVVGDIHGNEPAGIAIARRLDRGPARTGLDLWVIDDLNPDGVIAGTRQNAHGVDLNRNFPYRWRPAGSPFDQQYPGPRPLSEPEARAAYRLIVRIRPAVTIWFHQPLGLVDDSGGSRRIEAGFARSAGLPLRPLTRYPGSAMGWQDHALPSTTAFVVELAPGRLSGPALARITNAVLGLAR
jgi:protein MpaA